MDSRHEIAQLQTTINQKAPLTYMRSYGELKDFYQDKFGQKGWIGGLAQAITGSDARSGKEYLAARRSIERYEKGQFATMKKYTPELPRVGKQLPPTGRSLPGGQFTIEVKGEQSDSKGGTRPRSFKATFQGSEALGFANNPSYRAILKKLGYPTDVIDMMEAGEYELTISSVA